MFCRKFRNYLNWFPLICLTATHRAPLLWRPVPQFDLPDIFWNHVFKQQRAARPFHIHSGQLAKSVCLDTVGSDEIWASHSQLCRCSDLSS